MKQGKILLCDKSNPIERETEMGNKREWLTRIVSGLGMKASPAQIREEAYRVGYGKISQSMLVLVRNTLWPERKKHGGGFTRTERRARAEVESILKELVRCPQCNSAMVYIDHTWKLKDGRRTRIRTCNDCNYRWKRQEQDDGLMQQQIAGSVQVRLTNRIQWALTKERMCTCCKCTLPVEKFSLRADSEIIRRSKCKECTNEHRSKTQARDTLKRHGLTEEQYRLMLENQDGRCAICRTDKPFGNNVLRKRKRRVFSVDHCHTTGIVRGLLCTECNLAIGNFRDSIDLLQAAIAYIERYK